MPRLCPERKKKKKVNKEEPQPGEAAQNGSKFYCNYCKAWKVARSGFCSGTCAKKAYHSDPNPPTEEEKRKTRIQTILGSTDPYNVLLALYLVTIMNMGLGIPGLGEVARTTARIGCAFGLVAMVCEFFGDVAVGSCRFVHSLRHVAEIFIGVALVLA